MDWYKLMPAAVRNEPNSAPGAPRLPGPHTQNAGSTLQGVQQEKEQRAMAVGSPAAGARLYFFAASG